MREAREKIRMRLVGYCCNGSRPEEAGQEDIHYLTVLRYVERNPLRAQLVQRSQDWSSLMPAARSGPDGLLVDGTVVKPDSWGSK